MKKEPIKVSNSEISTWDSCKRHWYLSYFRGLTKKEVKVVGALATGNRVHQALEVFYIAAMEGKNIDLLEAHSTLIESARLDLALNGMNSEDLDKDAELERVMLSGYLEWVAEEGVDANYDVVGVEERLSYPIIPGRAELTGKVDMLLRDKRTGTNTVLDFKPQPISELVLTPSGFRPIGDIAVGDYVMGSDYRPTRVTGVYDKGVQPVQKVTFNDGAEVRATKDHPWPIVDITQNFHIVETKNLMKRGVKVVPITPSDKQPDVDLPVDPYILGVWIGDGGIIRVASKPSGRGQDDGLRVRITVPDHNFGIVEYIKKVDSTSRFTTVEGRSEGHKKLHTVSTLFAGESVYDLDIAHRHSYERELPEAYLTGSKRQRLAVLRGLMDADGTVATYSFSTKFDTTSKQLALDICNLVRSLGGNAWIGHTHMGKYSTKNSSQYVETRLTYGVTIKVPFCPFKLSTNAKIWKKKAKASKKLWDKIVAGEVYSPAGKAKNIYNPNIYRRKPVSVEEDGTESTRCIRVEAEDSLYITNGMVLTHNTAASYNYLLTVAQFAPQLLTYLSLYLATHPESHKELLSGAYRILKKTKRTARAKGPFYLDHEVRYSRDMLRSHWEHMKSKITVIADARDALSAGVSHHTVSPPTVSSECGWRCPFVAVCPMIDESKQISEEFLSDNYDVQDPRAYLEKDTLVEHIKKGKRKNA